MPEEAEEHLKEALVLDPEYIDALITLASLYNEREKYEELVDLLSYSKEIWRIPLLNAFMAYAYEREEQYEDAYESYSKAYGGMKDDHGFLERFANFLVEEGKRDEAVGISQGIGQTSSRRSVLESFS